MDPWKIVSLSKYCQYSGFVFETSKYICTHPSVENKHGIDQFCNEKICPIKTGKK